MEVGDTIFPVLRDIALFAPIHDSRGVRRFVTFLDALSRRSYDLANGVSGIGGTGIPQHGKAGPARVPVPGLQYGGTQLAGCEGLLRVGGRDLGPDRPGAARPLPRLPTGSPKKGRTHIQNFLVEASKALGEVDGDTQGELLKLSGALLAESPYAVVDFLSTSPLVLEKIPRSDLIRWFDEGMDILRENEEGGIAYFKLESVKGRGCWKRYPPGVELDKIREILWMYAVALTGIDVQIQTGDDLREKGIGWVSGENPTTEGRSHLSASLRPQVRLQGGKLRLVQGCRDTSGCTPGVRKLQVRVRERGRNFPNLRKEWAGSNGKASTAAVDLQRYFDLFPERQLAYDLFTLSEDTRLDSRVLYEYKGIRKSYRLTQDDALTQRPDIESLPLQEAIVELLLRISLDQNSDLKVPTKIKAQVEELVRILMKVRPPGPR